MLAPLKKWFLSEQRDLPWRINRTPYSVWVSEMMLQQTQVSVVIPYFERWMQRFPTVKHLADASLDEVIKTWEGLGYYSRARYLHEGAKHIVVNHQGIFPEDSQELKKIKGLGPYTIGAIRSFAFHHKTSAVDGNVLRVLSRYFLIDSDIAKSSTVKQFQNLAESILPEKEPWIINEALIELGATICTKKPKCISCPLKSSCQAYLQGKTSLLPFKSTKIQIETLYRAVAVIRYQDQYLLKRGAKGKIMSDLYEFPYFETNEEGLGIEELQCKIRDQFACEVQIEVELPLVRHSFTRFRANLMPVQFSCKERGLLKENYHWIPYYRLTDLPFSSGHRQIVQEILKR